MYIRRVESVESLRVELYGNRVTHCRRSNFVGHRDHCHTYIRVAAVVGDGEVDRIFAEIAAIEIRHIQSHGSDRTIVGAVVVDVRFADSCRTRRVERNGGIHTNCLRHGVVRYGDGCRAVCGVAVAVRDRKIDGVRADVSAVEFRIINHQSYRAAVVAAAAVDVCRGENEHAAAV